MDYEAIDRYHSLGAVTCLKNGTRFYLTDDETASDDPERARKFRSNSEAYLAALSSCEEYAWRGFAWYPIPYFTIFQTEAP